MDNFKKFWVVTVNNWICDASYSGKDLKAKHVVPSFRKFHFIKKMEDLRGLALHKDVSNEELCKKLLIADKAVLEAANK